MGKRSLAIRQFLAWAAGVSALPVIAAIQFDQPLSADLLLGYLFGAIISAMSMAFAASIKS